MFYGSHHSQVTRDKSGQERIQVVENQTTDFLELKFAESKKKSSSSIQDRLFFKRKSLAVINLNFLFTTVTNDKNVWNYYIASVCQTKIFTT